MAVLGGMEVFPSTPEAFAALEAQGKTVEYAETPNSETPPEGDGWVYWSNRVTEDESVAVWRRIVPISE